MCPAGNFTNNFTDKWGKDGKIGNLRDFTGKVGIRREESGSCGKARVKSGKDGKSRVTSEIQSKDRDKREFIWKRAVNKTQPGKL